MGIQYKVSDIAKDLNVTNKKILELLEPLNIDLSKKHNTMLNEGTVNVFFEKLTVDNTVQNLDEYLNNAKNKGGNTKENTEKENNNINKNAGNQDHKKHKKQAIKREDSGTIVKIGTLAEGSDADSVKKSVRHIDTKLNDVDLERYNEKYEKIAPASGIINDNVQRKQKLHQRSSYKNRRGMRKGNRNRVSEAEKLQRIQEMNNKKKQLQVTIPEEITVNNLALILKVTGAEVVKKLMGLGEMATLTQTIDYDTAETVALEFGAKVEREIVVTIEERVIDDLEDHSNDLETRSPVVVVMGHVDHGKTSLLDAIRKNNVTETEAGGITQHIGAYKVTINDKSITFLDTPGHEAFTSMRARGASITDIAILVVAADDGIMPQTVEAINHAKAAGISIIVAINKIDKPGANPDKVLQELTEHEILPEEWGGDTICVPVSAKNGENLDKLLETVQLVADVQELKANPNRSAKGVVIEAHLDKGKGPVATVLVQNGTLKIGDAIIVGSSIGRVRVMSDENEHILKEANPSTPVEITGLSEVPSAGDELNVVKDEKLAKILVEERKWKAKEEKMQAYQKVTLDNIFSRIEQGEIKDLPIIIKADVQGSAEAVKQSLEKIGNDEVRVRVIHSGVGAISESDVMLAGASNAIIVGFNVRPNQNAKITAEKEEIEIRFYRIIYDAIEEIKDAMRGMLAPKFREVENGRAEVRLVYRISSIGAVAGSYVLTGHIKRKSKIRVIRDSIVIAEDEISSLKRFKDDAKEVARGYECGISLVKFHDIKEGDILEAFEIEEYRD